MYGAGVSYFLLVYNRRQGCLLDERVFTDRHEALTSRFAAERQYPPATDVEVVVVAASSREALAKTHGRYFKSTEALIGDLVPQ